MVTGPNWDQDMGYKSEEFRKASFSSHSASLWEAGWATSGTTETAAPPVPIWGSSGGWVGLVAEAWLLDSSQTLWGLGEGGLGSFHSRPEVSGSCGEVSGTPP